MSTAALYTIGYVVAALVTMAIIAATHEPRAMSDSQEDFDHEMGVVLKSVAGGMFWPAVLAFWLFAGALFLVASPALLVRHVQRKRMDREQELAAAEQEVDRLLAGTR